MQLSHSNGVTQLLSLFVGRMEQRGSRAAGQHHEHLEDKTRVSL